MINIIEKMNNNLSSNKSKFNNFIELSYEAWKYSEEVNKQIKAQSLRETKGDALADKGVDSLHYWIYSPGNKAYKWEDYYKEGVMGIRWDIGDLNKFPTKESMKKQMKNETMLIDGELYDATTGELINEVEQVEVEVLEDTLPNIVLSGGTHIKTNTEQLKKELVIYLKKYDVEVTEDNEKDCSKLATELNSLSKDLDTKRKSVASEIKKPADDLKSAVDELIAIIQEKRTKILNDVEVYKAKRMDF